VTKPNPENCKNCSSKCAYDCAQLQQTIQHRTVLKSPLLPPDKHHSSDVVYWGWNTLHKSTLESLCTMVHANFMTPDVTVRLKLHSAVSAQTFFFVAVHANIVTMQVAGLNETFVAQRTRVRFLAGMHSHVTL